MPQNKYYRSTGWIATYVKCPFWKGTDRRTIVCEGLNKGELIHRVMPVARKQGEMEEFCCDHYENCRIYKMLYAGYE